MQISVNTSRIWEKPGMLNINFYVFAEVDLLAAPVGETHGFQYTLSHLDVMTSHVYS